ncbi:hypothetical protein KCU61_g361, partial [Aureobasidium melanogenum]
MYQKCISQARTRCRRQRNETARQRMGEWFGWLQLASCKTNDVRIQVCQLGNWAKKRSRSVTQRRASLASIQKYNSLRAGPLRLYISMRCLCVDALLFRSVVHRTNEMSITRQLVLDSLDQVSPPGQCREPSVSVRTLIDDRGAHLAALEGRGDQSSCDAAIHFKGCRDGTPPGVIPAFEFVPLSPTAFFFSFLAHRKPHALHNVLGPLGPLRHSGLSRVPQSAQTYSSATLSFFFFSLVPSRSLSSKIAMPASPLISAGDVSPVEIP